MNALKIWQQVNLIPDPCVLSVDWLIQQATGNSTLSDVYTHAKVGSTLPIPTLKAPPSQPLQLQEFSIVSSFALSNTVEVKPATEKRKFGLAF